MTLFRRHESQDDDDQRTDRFLDDIEETYTARGGDGGPLDEFEETVLMAASPTDETRYPPPGHGYPRR